MTPVLMIDDDTELCEMVAEYLKPEGFSLKAVHDGASGVLAAREDYALILLDVMLPQMNGLEVLRRIRSGEEPYSRIPILMLTARGDSTDRVLGLEIGADDYLPKPFDERELVARMRAILRRAAPTPNTLETLHVGDVEINVGARVAKRGKEGLQLTSVEFDLLVMLVRAAGTVVERDRVAREVLGRTLLHFDRSIDTHVSRLRRKLGPRKDGGERIATLRGVGYLYTLPNDGEG